MKLSRKVVLFIALVLLYLPLKSEAGFVVKKTDLITVSTIAAKENTGSTTLATSSSAGSNIHSVSAVTHKKTFFGRLFQKFGGGEHNVFAGAKKKWVAILLGLLDIFVIGGIGLPRFYMGYTSEGVMQLIFYLLGAVGIVCLILAFGLANFALLIPAYLCLGLFVFSLIWQVVDVIRIMCNSLKPKEGYWD